MKKPHTHTLTKHIKTNSNTQKKTLYIYYIFNHQALSNIRMIYIEEKKTLKKRYPKQLPVYTLFYENNVLLTENIDL